MTHPTVLKRLFLFSILPTVLVLGGCVPNNVIDKESLEQRVEWQNGDVLFDLLLTGWHPKCLRTLTVKNFSKETYSSFDLKISYLNNNKQVISIEEFAVPDLYPYRPTIKSSTGKLSTASSGFRKVGSCVDFSSIQTQIYIDGIAKNAPSKKPATLPQQDFESVAKKNSELNGTSDREIVSFEKTEEKEAATNKRILQWAAQQLKKKNSSFKKIFPKKLDIERGRYETTAQYEKRLKRKAKGHMNYDIEQDINNGSYDADTGKFVARFKMTDAQVSNWADYSGTKKNNVIGLQHGFEVLADYKNKGSYIGQNAYGTKVAVEDSNLYRYYVYSPNFKSFFQSSELKIDAFQYGSNYVTFSSNFSARKIKSVDENLRLRLVYSVPESLLDFHEDSIYVGATISSKQSISSFEYFMRADLVGVIIYNKQSREIYYAFKK